MPPTGPDGRVEHAGPRSRLRALVAPTVVAVGAATALGYLGVVSPYAAGNYPTCPTLALTGTYCPGCGSLRALHSLVGGDVAGAWDMNPLALVLLPVVVGTWVAWTRRRATGRPRSWLAPPWVLHGLLAVVVVYWIARNVPALAPWLAPGV